MNNSGLDIDAHHQVDDWNRNYNKQKGKLEKKKMSKKGRRKVD